MSCDCPAPIEPHIVYGFFERDRCVYVGLTSERRWPARRYEHETRSTWWAPDLCSHPLGTFPTREEAARAEADLIIEFQPRNNRQVPCRP